MCLFRIFQRNQTVIPESHIASIKNNYIQFVQELREYKEFMEHTFPKNLDYSTVIQLYKHDYLMRSKYIARIHALYDRIELNYLCNAPYAYEYYIRAKTKYKPLFDELNDSFYNKLLITHTHNNFYIDETLVHNSSLMDLFKDQRQQPQLFKSNKNNTDTNI